jgi:hypothetical protein
MTAYCAASIFEAPSCPHSNEEHLKEKIQGETRMKRLLSYAAVMILTLVAGSQIMAQSNPALGTWKLDVAKSKYSSGAPSELTRTLEADGDSTKYTFAGKSADGNPISYSFTSKYDGQDSPITGTGPGGADAIAIKKVNAYSYDFSVKINGKTTATGKSTVSKDGKTTTVTISGKDKDGKAMSSTAVYDKQ